MGMGVVLLELRLAPAWLALLFGELLVELEEITVVTSLEVRGDSLGMVWMGVLPVLEEQVVLE
jgi:hypothetical protein